MKPTSPTSWLHGSRRSAIAIAIATATVASVGLAAAVTAGPAAAGTRWRWTHTTTTKPAPTTTPTTTPTTAQPPATTPTTTTEPAPTTTQPPSTTPSTLAPSTGATASVLFGAAVDPGPDDFSGLTTFEADAGKQVSLYGYYQSFAFDKNFNTSAADAVRARGATPMVTWEPWDPSSGSAAQPAYSLQNIASGAFDSYISRWASQTKAWGQPLWLRFAHEMNGDWYPWGADVNGNSPAQYVAAWRHVHDIFTQAGARNVTWVWSPNVTAPGWTSLSQLYPGDAYVDWMGLDGYNWGTTQSWGSAWQTPSEVFGATLTDLRQLSSRPIVIAETASAEAGGNKAQWISQFFSMLVANPDVKAFVWFNNNKETDWRIESSSAARSAFAAGIADSRYRSA